MDSADAAALAWQVRRLTLTTLHQARASHAGSCLSCVEILAALYAPGSGWLRHDPADPEWEGRDRFIMSKGHAAAALYATLARRGYFPEGWLETYCGDGARLGGHCTRHGVPGVELSTGSLGHGLPVGLGMALGLQARGGRVAVLLGDGELNEGSNWEAILLAPRLALGNLVAIVDYNKIQSFGRVDEVIPLEPLAQKWRAFGWESWEVNGHDLGALQGALAAASRDASRPAVIIAHTVKGRGVGFMEDELAWHYRNTDAAQLAAALAEVDAAWQAQEAR